jgi:DNA-binding CsgD family transcriptional regulator
MRHHRTHPATSITLGHSRPTPRQRQILELAALGLSDEEIAARLKVSSRTVRFQLERIFRTLGVRGRAEAIAAWIALTDQSRRPVDECPYPKPFAEHFAECPAYEARQAVTLDERSRPTGRIWTCQHLESRLAARTEDRWYGACVLGDAVDRQRWAEWIGADRTHVLNQLIHELAPATGPFAQRLWELKGEQARALERNEDTGPATELMEALASRFIDYLESFLNWHRSQLGRNQLPIDECLSYAQRLIDRVLDKASPGSWDERFDALVSFPKDVWRADAVGETEPGGSAVSHSVTRPRRG